MQALYLDTDRTLESQRLPQIKTSHLRVLGSRNKVERHSANMMTIYVFNNATTGYANQEAAEACARVR